jgi:sirohydrochlorin ferrochelatase
MQAIDRMLQYANCQQVFMSVVLEQDTQPSYDAYFLVTHGSKDLHSWLALQESIECANALSDVVVGGGCLEGQAFTLAQQLQHFCEELCEQSDTDNLNVAIVPLFLLSGVHVMQDIPNEVAIAQQKSIDSIDRQDRSIALKIVPHLGTHPQIPALLQFRLEAQVEALKQHPKHPNQNNIGFILLSHGSRRLEALQDVEAIAQQLGAVAAYWSVPPDLDTQIEQLIAQGKESIIILPYLLATGGILTAIAQRTSLYADRILIDIAPIPLSAAQIADLAIDLINYCK